jgi:hypothetical protein
VVVGLSVLLGLAILAGLPSTRSSRVEAAGLGSVTAPRAQGSVAVCGDATGDGEVMATDSLLILRVSVGLTVCADPCVCDVNSDGSINATDSLIVLRHSVDPLVVLDCAGCMTTTFTLPPTTVTTVTTTSTSTTTTIAGFTLEVQLLGDGDGTVTDNRDGIDCGSDCIETYAEDTSVTLTAVPQGCTASVGRSAFLGWDGDTPSGACTGTGTCTFTMTQPRVIEAIFGDACPKNAPITDLQTDCEDHGYFYRVGPLAEGLATNGEDIELVQIGQSGTITYEGTVETATTFELSTATPQGGSSQDLANGSVGSISGDGRSLDVTVVLPSGGGTFEFLDALWFDEACIEPASVISNATTSPLQERDAPAFVGLLEALRR